MFSQEIELRGHIIDSLLLPKVLDEILSHGGDFKIRQIQIGQQRTDPSYARIEVFGPSPEAVDDLIKRLRVHGAELVDDSDAQLDQAPSDGVFPPKFYVTTNQQTFVRVRGKWIEVQPAIMDSGISVDEEKSRATAVKFYSLRKGMKCVIGHRGVRVIPLQRSNDRMSVFEFMASKVSTEKPKAALIRAMAEEIDRVRKEGRKILVVAGPAVVHTGAGEHLEKLIARNYIQLLFAGNALAVHDIEHALYGTSLGVDLKHGALAQSGHQNHIHAINAIRAAGGIEKAVQDGVLGRGIMYECVRHRVDFVLAGSIRDDGPLPEVITDVIEAQKAMRGHIEEVGIALMMGTMLHSIAVGNLLPAHVKTISVDISPAVVTKLTDRGTFQSIGLVTDIEPFLRELTGLLIPQSQTESTHAPPAALPA
jgi:lysine-ketoglutarate reductase/saccharopine dehydrogenase-like protein (TIGR00300 family)